MSRIQILGFSSNLTINTLINNPRTHSHLHNPYFKFAEETQSPFMARRRRGEENDEFINEEFDEEQEENRGRKKRRSSQIIDDVEEEEEDEEDDDDDDEDDEEEDEDEEDDDNGGRGNRKKRTSAARFIDDMAVVDTDGDEDDEDVPEDGFIDDDAVELQEEDHEENRVHRRPFLPREEEGPENVEELERFLKNKFGDYVETHDDDNDQMEEVEQQAFLPSVKDPKLWKVTCAVGHEREIVACLMQKSVNLESRLQIKSAVALDHLKGCIYVEAAKEAHVKEACKGLRNIYLTKVLLVPLKEMTDVLSVESKAADLSRDMWVRMKAGIYKGDLAKVVDVDNIHRRVIVMLIPRIDLQDLASKLEGREVVKKKVMPVQRLMNSEEARNMRIRVKPERHPRTGDYVERIGGLMFKDGFLLKEVAVTSISSKNIEPSFDELDKFRGAEDGDADTTSFSALNINKRHFMKGDAVIVVKGELQNLMGWVEKVEEKYVHIKPKLKDFTGSLVVIYENDLCKYFQPGDHVKVVYGAHEGAIGMVVKIEGNVLIIVSDTTKENLHVFADDVVESSKVTTSVSRIGDYELHDLVLLDNGIFGVITRVEKESFQVLKGVPDRSEIDFVKLREIKRKVDKKTNAKDRANNVVSVKDVVTIVEGPCKGKKGPVEHIYGGLVFIKDRHHHDHAGYICTKAQSCIVFGGSNNCARKAGSLDSRIPTLRTPPQLPRGETRTNFGARRGKDSLVGRTVKVCSGGFKGYRGRVVDVNGESVRLELESKMNLITVKRSEISDKVAVSTPHREIIRTGLGSETPMHPPRTPLRPLMTPMRGSGATPIHDGIRTPMRDQAWNPYTPMSPARDNWEEQNPSAQSQVRTVRSYEAPTPSSTSYLPDTPGSELMGVLLSPTIGGEGEELWFLPGILVNVRSEGEPVIGVVKEVLRDGSCNVCIGSASEIICVLQSEMDIVVPKMKEKITVLSGGLRGATGRLISIDLTDGIVKMDETLDVKILDMAILAKSAEQH